ncbi:hypothetical protein FXO37_26282 [Capsicum annuum]|nr:hypothetical protein FXO37_26282 [Capsicum annuum]
MIRMITLTTGIDKDVIYEYYDEHVQAFCKYGIAYVVLPTSYGDLLKIDLKKHLLDVTSINVFYNQGNLGQFVMELKESLAISINAILNWKGYRALCRDCKVIPSENLVTQHRLLVMDLVIKKGKMRRGRKVWPKSGFQAPDTLSLNCSSLSNTFDIFGKEVMKYRDAAQIVVIKAMQVASATESLLRCEFRVFMSFTVHLCFDLNLMNLNAKLSDFGLAKVEPIGDPSYALPSVLVFCVCIILVLQNLFGYLSK